MTDDFENFAETLEHTWPPLVALPPAEHERVQSLLDEPLEYDSVLTTAEQADLETAEQEFAAAFMDLPILAVGEKATTELVQILTVRYEDQIMTKVEELRTEIETIYELREGSKVEVIYFGFDRLLSWSPKGAAFVRGGSDQQIVLGYLAWDVTVGIDDFEGHTHSFGVDLNTGELF